MVCGSAFYTHQSYLQDNHYYNVYCLLPLINHEILHTELRKGTVKLVSRQYKKGLESRNMNVACTVVSG